MSFNMKLMKMFGMIIFTVSLADLVNSVTREQMEAMSQGFRNTCLKKTEADLTLVEGLRNGQFPEGDMKLKCYTRCIMGLMKTFKDGKLNLDALIKQINLMAADHIAIRLSDVAKKCYDEVREDDPCEYTWSYSKCSYKGDPEVWFFP